MSEGLTQTLDLDEMIISNLQSDREFCVEWVKAQDEDRERLLQEISDLREKLRISEDNRKVLAMQQFEALGASRSHEEAGGYRSAEEGGLGQPRANVGAFRAYTRGIMATEFQRGMRRAAQIAALYADENMRIVHDTILCDPILNRDKRSTITNPTELMEATAVSKKLALKSHEHSSRSHAGKDIADLIRKEAAQAKPGKRK